MPFFQADSDQLKEIARMFTNEAESLEERLAELRSIAESIRGNAWIGLGAERFFEIYDSNIVPGIERLINFYEANSQQADQMAGRIEDGIAYILSRAQSSV